MWSLLRRFRNRKLDVLNYRLIILSDQFAVNWSPVDLVHCHAVNISFIPIFTDGAANIFASARVSSSHLRKTRSLHAEVLLMKTKYTVIGDF